VSGHANPNVLSFATDTLTLVYPRVTSVITVITVSLNGTIEWVSNIASCDAHKITSYSDSGGTSLTTTSDQIRL
jgi:hypothetical protein